MSTPSGFDELIHPATRLSVVALLASTEWADFGFIRDSLSLSDSALSKQLHTLEDAGYLDLRKEGSGRKRRTRVRLTERGRTAFDGHVAALRAIVEGAAGPAAVTGLGTGTATGPGTDADRAGAAAAPAAVAPAGAEAGR
ncbi:transcriptional regulator [Streptomyces sp. XM4011]|uniref:transcriptional regulator n=1 Tax=Streptomyces TaxID=1883 RepID=UPI001590E59E|nr:MULTISPECIES: transcriptional regulator [Streptomyces]MCK1815408.1 transcriptional regulator [Streptomyces sp. XM4011]QKV69392.1 transcriptional regulator [Streptomyces harbinensis]